MSNAHNAHDNNYKNNIEAARKLDQPWEFYEGTTEDGQGGSGLDSDPLPPKERWEAAERLKAALEILSRDDKFYEEIVNGDDKDSNKD